MKLWQSLKNWAFWCLVAEGSAAEWSLIHQWSCPCSREGRLSTRVMRDQPPWGLGAHRRSWHILCLNTGKASPEGPHSLHSAWRMCVNERFGVAKAGSPSFHGEDRSSSGVSAFCHFVAHARLSGDVSGYQGSKPSPSLTRDSLGVNGS